MLVKEFKTNCSLYENFEIWDIENIDSFFKGNSILKTIFAKDYQMTVSELKSRRHEIADTDMLIIQKSLDQIGDKHFFIFTYHDDNHSELVEMQMMKQMNFGIDIEQIAKDHLYVVIMDKKSGEVPFF